MTMESTESTESAKDIASPDTGESENVEPTETAPERPNANGRNRTTGNARRWISSAIRWAAVVMVVALLAGAGYEGWLLYQRHKADVAAAQALDAAEQFAVTLTSTDPDAVDQNFTDVLNGATGDFKDTYTKAGARLRKVLIDNKVETHGSVVDSAVKSATGNKVEVLLFIRQTVSNSSAPASQTDFTAVAITMEKVDGRWLASKVVLPSEQQRAP